MWDGDRLKEMDLVLAEAAKGGVKLIIPIINQDTGEECVFCCVLLGSQHTDACVPQLELGRLDGGSDALPLRARLERRGAARRLVD